MSQSLPRNSGKSGPHPLIQRGVGLRPHRRMLEQNREEMTTRNLYKKESFSGLLKIPSPHSWRRGKRG